MMESARFLAVVACGVMILCEDTDGMKKHARKGITNELKSRIVQAHDYNQASQIATNDGVRLTKLKYQQLKNKAQSADTDSPTSYSISSSQTHETAAASLNSSQLSQDCVNTMERLYGDCISDSLKLIDNATVDDCDTLIDLVYDVWYDSYNVTSDTDRAHMDEFCELLSKKFVDLAGILNSSGMDEKECLAYVLVLSQIKDWENLKHNKALQWRSDKQDFLIQDARNMLVNKERNKVDDFIQKHKLRL